MVKNTKNMKKIVLYRVGNQTNRNQDLYFGGKVCVGFDKYVVNGGRRSS